MRIEKISLYRVDLPLLEGTYRWARDQQISVFDSNIVVLETDTGLTGVGEFCALGSHYLPAFAAGARAGICELAPLLLHRDPCEIDTINLRMDEALKGHPYVKSAIDIALWDILGQHAKLPLCTLLGGRHGEDYALYRAISQGSPDEMARSVRGYRRQGYRKFQLKVGGAPADDTARILSVAAELQAGDTLAADANTGWLVHEAIQCVQSLAATHRSRVEHIQLYIEQPCATLEECLEVRRHSPFPLVLDECISTTQELLRAAQARAMDVLNIKISRVGGLTKARRIRDLCIDLGIAVTLEDSWGSDVATATISHLAHSTPSKFLFSSSDFNSYTSVETALGSPKARQGRLSAGTSPGLGLKIRKEILGKPVAEFGG